MNERRINMRYELSDGVSVEEIEADNWAEAHIRAKDWVAEGDWNTDQMTKTTWVNIRISDENGDLETEKVQIDPDEPPCINRHAEHDWQKPVWLGGCEENPGVYGHGGGCRGTEVCMKCGTSKTWDSWAQDPEDGQQGLDSVEYNEGEFRDKIEEKT